MSLYETGVRPIIDEYLLEESQKTRDYGNYWSASSAGYCMRKVIMERLTVPKVSSSSDARKQRVFTSGHIFHSWIQELTKKTGVSIAQELELQDEELMIRGHIDDLLLIDDKLLLVDYKTVNSGSFTWAKKKGNGMSWYHRMQLGTYLHMLRNLKATDHKEIQRVVELMEQLGLEESRVLKISKDDLRMKEEQLMWSPELEKEVTGYWRTLNGYWSKKLLPKCTCDQRENGFMATEKWNPFFYEGEPCSIKWLAKHKELAEGWKIKR